MWRSGSAADCKSVGPWFNPERELVGSYFFNYVLFLQYQHSTCILNSFAFSCSYTHTLCSCTYLRKYLFDVFFFLLWASLTDKHYVLVKGKGPKAQRLLRSMFFRMQCHISAVGGAHPFFFLGRLTPQSLNMFHHFLRQYR